MFSTKNVISLLLLVVMAAGLPAIARAGVNTDDIRSGVQAALSRYYLTPFDVTVDDNGRVIIKGQVDSYYDKLDVYELASRVPGVTEIEDLVDINTDHLPDNMIKANILESLDNSAVIVEPDSIDVTVTDGLVFLSGTVSYAKEKLHAETIAADQDGVMGLDNEIQVLSPEMARTDENLQNVLNELVKSQFPLLVGKVKYTVAKGDVTLEGNVTSLWEKSHLPIEISRVAGVKHVVNNLKITI